MAKQKVGSPIRNGFSYYVLTKNFVPETGTLLKPEIVLTLA